MISTRGKPLGVLADMRAWESAAARYSLSLGLSSPNRFGQGVADGRARQLPAGARERMISLLEACDDESLFNFSLWDGQRQLLTEFEEAQAAGTG